VVGAAGGPPGRGVVAPCASTLAAPLGGNPAAMNRWRAGLLGGAGASPEEPAAIPAAEKAAAGPAGIVVLIAALITTLIRVALEPREQACARGLGTHDKKSRSEPCSGEERPASHAILPFQH